MQLTSEPPRVTADECVRQIRFARAADLARRGDYAEAEALLSEPTEGREFDLLARIAAHKEDFERAKQLWRKACENEPKNFTYKECLHQLSHPYEGRKFRAWMMCCTVTVLITTAAGLYILFRSGSQSTTHRPQPVASAAEQKLTVKNPPKTTPALAPAEFTQATSSMRAEINAASDSLNKTFANSLKSQTQDIVSSIAELRIAADADRSQLDKQIKYTQAQLERLLEAQHMLTQTIEQTRAKTEVLNAKLDGIIAARSPQRSKLDFADVQIAGVNVREINGEWYIRFERGLFDYDDHFKIGAKSKLIDVVQSVARMQAPLKITIIGSAGDEPPTWPWREPIAAESLAVRRAEAARKVIEKTRILPRGCLTIAGSNKDSIYSTKDRSVILRITPFGLNPN